MELMVVRINGKQIVVIVPIIIDGNIYGTKNVHFWDTILKFYTKIFETKKGPDPFGPVATQYCELRDETICIEQPAIAALQCIKNQLPTRSGSAYKS
jgi:hypothetical protein